MNRQYLVAAAAVAAALLLRYLLNPVLGPQGPYLILTLPIVAAAVYGGLGPALLATALGTSAGTYLFIDRGAGLHDVLQPENLARTLLFVVIGLAIGLMGGQLQRSRWALADKVRQLKSSNRAKDNAMAVLGHEIRNPLSAIHSAQTVLQQNNLPPHSHAIDHDHAAFDTGSSAPLPRPSGLSRACSKPSFPIKPDSGGMPMISSAQAIKLSPRNAMVQGIT